MYFRVIEYCIEDNGMNVRVYLAKVNLLKLEDAI